VSHPLDQLAIDATTSRLTRRATLERLLVAVVAGSPLAALGARAAQAASFAAADACSECKDSVKESFLETQIHCARQTNVVLTPFGALHVAVLACYLASAVAGLSGKLSCHHGDACRPAGSGGTGGAGGGGAGGGPGGPADPCLYLCPGCYCGTCPSAPGGKVPCYLPDKDGKSPCCPR
jgi:hypothetical protein